MNKIGKINIAVTQGPEMAAFYKSLFSIKWQTSEYDDFVLYRSMIGDIELMLIPKEIAGKDISDNNIQLSIAVSDIVKVISDTSNSGGKVVNKITEHYGVKVAGVLDPDGNTLEIYQE